MIVMPETFRDETLAEGLFLSCMGMMQSNGEQQKDVVALEIQQSTCQIGQWRNMRTRKKMFERQPVLMF